ncbi:hypothetical protein ARMGADRAFT_1038419 [Armillaria gallica]|uniref:Uncharacterized protein n=1 Tax=Armillaria gallica TaxID=47427 RepID=A0A2H3CI31_ARMGA|nr:hypothetical protein ARMGADRAFT_1038419 [Armillaria gallica]
MMGIRSVRYLLLHASGCYSSNIDHGIGVGSPGPLLAQFDWISTITHSPDITALFRLNDLPSPLQSFSLETSSDNLEDTRQDIQAAVDLLENLVTLLESQMSRIRSLQHDYILVLSPLHGGRCHVSRFDVCNVAEGLWYLGQVCRPLSVHSAPGYGRHLNGDLVRMLQHMLERTEHYHAPLLRHYNESFHVMERGSSAVIRKAKDPYKLLTSATALDTVLVLEERWMKIILFWWSRF